MLRDSLPRSEELSAYINWKLRLVKKGGVRYSKYFVGEEGIFDS